MGEKFYYIYSCRFQLDFDVCVTKKRFLNEEEFFEEYSDRCKILDKIQESQFSEQTIGKSVYHQIKNIKDN